MAVAFDAKSEKNWVSSGTTHTWSHTCTGSNLILFVGGQIDNTGDKITGITYNGVAMTKIMDVSGYDKDAREYLYYLIAPATGANNVVITCPSSVNGDFFATSFSGARQSSQPDSSASGGTGSATQASFSLTTNVVTADSMLIGCFRQVGADEGWAAGANTTIDYGTALNNNSHSTATVGTGNQSLSFTYATTRRRGGAIIASIAPSPSPSGGPTRRRFIRH